MSVENGETKRNDSKTIQINQSFCMLFYSIVSNMVVVDSMAASITRIKNVYILIQFCVRPNNFPRSFSDSNHNFLAIRHLCTYCVWGVKKMYSKKYELNCSREKNEGLLLQFEPALKCILFDCLLVHLIQIRRELSHSLKQTH